jgi:hypothetical protein
MPVKFFAEIIISHQFPFQLLLKLKKSLFKPTMGLWGKSKGAAKSKIVFINLSKIKRSSRDAAESNFFTKKIWI